MLIYDGPSQLDGVTPILGIVTKGSRNRKTGPMDQLWILVKQATPAHAARTGADSAVCGDCWLRRTLCYVVLPQGPRAVWDAFCRGRYQWGQPSGDALRLGAYGDPAALPLGVILDVTRGYNRWTGYTHQWRKAPWLQRFCMASVETAADAAEAHAEGWRTFRIRTAADPLSPKEIPCVYETHKHSCWSCKLCDGSSVDDRRLSITITAHGKAAQSFAARAARWTAAHGATLSGQPAR